MKTSFIFPFTSLTTKIPFGKYKGRTLDEILLLDLNYAEWMLYRCNSLAFSKPITDQIKRELYQAQ